MPLVTLSEVLAAKDQYCAVGAFSTYDLYTAQGLFRGQREQIYLLLPW
ncbi:hypothetical protein N752_30930 [Desulforamulus aquiferis]|nr:hypothetical protein [Desulforamulus aquiferis]RYD01411.1 hypothetical protein N752_30930 [Desulforamulus aquiferis]